MRLHLSCLFGPGVVSFIFSCFQTLSHFLINIKVWKEKGIMYRNSFISLWEERIGQLRLVLANHVLYNYSFSPNKNIVKAYSKTICKERNVINQFSWILLNFWWAQCKWINWKMFPQSHLSLFCNFKIFQSFFLLDSFYLYRNQFLPITPEGNYVFVGNAFCAISI